jgi:uncharacterized repeat protein (TIGR01451 family)
VERRVTSFRLALTAVVAWLTLAVMAGGAQAAPGAWTQAQVNASTQAGVAYIDTQQNLNGSFGSTFPIAETGMALVAYSVVANGNFSNLSPAYQTHVQNAIAWLLTQQSGDGSWADFGFYQTYGTGIALAGLSAFTGVNAGVPAAISSGRAFLINEFQGSAYTGCSSADGSPTAYYCGGWNYDTGAGRSDQSNTGFAMFGLQLTGGIPAPIASQNIGWQHHVQEISTNSFAARNDGGADYEPGISFGSFSSNANDTGTMLFGLGYDGVPGTDANVLAGITFGQDVLDEYELEAPAGRTMVYHSGASEDGTCLIGPPSCDWNFAVGEGGYHYSIFSLTKGLGEFITPNLMDPNNWYAKVVDLLLTEQQPDGSWPQDGRDDGTTLMATAFAVSSLGLVAVPVQQNADLSITKSGPAFVQSGGTITYVITVNNGGPANATNVIVSDTLPAGETLISATPSQGSCGAPPVTCNLGTIANGGSATVTIVARVTAASGSTLSNTATVSGDQPDNDTSNNSSTTSAFVYGVPAGGNFVIGDRNAAVGTAVTFWGAQWWKLNSLSGGAGPASFKGFEDSPAVANCGTSWTTDPGNSTPPPAGPLPAYMAVIVSSSIGKSGSSISGNTVHIVIVKTNAGYAPDPGHAGTGKVFAQIC